MLMMTLEATGTDGFGGSESWQSLASASSRAVQRKASTNQAKWEATAGNLPTLLLAGTPKAGTSALFLYLMNQYADRVCVPTLNGVLEKEPNAIQNLAVGIPISVPWEKYFDHCNSNHTHKSDATATTDQIILEASTTTMLCPETLILYYQTHNNYITKATGGVIPPPIPLPLPKVVIVLRDPVDQQISMYSMLYSLATSLEGTPNRDYGLSLLLKPGGIAASLSNDTVEAAAVDDHLYTFQEYVEARIFPTIEESFPYYVTHLTKWFQLYDRQKLLLLSYEEYTSDSQRFLGRLHAFVGLPQPTAADPEAAVVDADTPKERANNTIPTVNAHPKRPPPPCAFRRAMAERYAPSNTATYALIQAQAGPSMEQRPFSPFASSRPVPCS